LAADVTFLIRSEVKVAIPHFLGGKEEINATFFVELFAIRNILLKQLKTPVETTENSGLSFYEQLLRLSSKLTAESDIKYNFAR